MRVLTSLMLTGFKAWKYSLKLKYPQKKFWIFSKACTSIFNWDQKWLEIGKSQYSVRLLSYECLFTKSWCFIIWLKFASAFTDQNTICVLLTRIVLHQLLLIFIHGECSTHFVLKELRQISIKLRTYWQCFKRCHDW